MTYQSEWHSPAAVTRSRTCPGPASGVGTSTTSGPPPMVRYCTARMGKSSGREQVDVPRTRCTPGDRGDAVVTRPGADSPGGAPRPAAPGALRQRASSERWRRNGRAPHPPEHQIGKHTSELQSRQYLVCRLLLEKKKIHLSHTST